MAQCVDISIIKIDTNHIDLLIFEYEENDTIFFPKNSTYYGAKSLCEKYKFKGTHL
jgi:hypothetical protein